MRFAFKEVTLGIDKDALIFGDNSFKTPFTKCACPLSLDGVSGKDWSYRAQFAFDGKALHATIAHLSSGIRNANLETSLPWLNDAEELIVLAPQLENLVLSATAETPTITAPLIGSFKLRDI